MNTPAATACAESSFSEWVKKHDLYDLPWQIDKKVLHEAYMAGWRAAAQQPVATAPLNAAQDGPTAEEIYKAYPRKVGKVAAIKAINKAITATARHGEGGWAGARAGLMMCTQLYAMAVAKWPPSEKQYIPHPATWFNQGRYDDDPKEWVRGNPGTSFTKEYNA